MYPVNLFIQVTTVKHPCQGATAKRMNEVKKTSVGSCVYASPLACFSCKSVQFLACLFATEGYMIFKRKIISQPAFTCSKLTTETLEQGVKYVQS